ncbi:MAG: DUF2933 domain-containing protein [Planctomycetota bacterium]|nr:DUF2933 domain-containing protein [Planctomycetota bacterium]
MSMHDHHKVESANDTVSSSPGISWYKSPLGLACLGIAVVAGYYLWKYHSQHVLAFLPFGIFLLCPLMHFMHGGHGHQHGSDSKTNKPDNE